MIHCKIAEKICELNRIGPSFSYNNLLKRVRGLKCLLHRKTEQQDVPILQSREETK